MPVLGGSWTEFGQIWPGFEQPSAISADVGGLNSAMSWPYFVIIGRTRPTFVRVRPHLGRRRSNLGNIGRRWSEFGQLFASFSQIWTIVTDAGKHRPNFAQVRQKFGHFGRSLFEIGHLLARLRQTKAISNVFSCCGSSFDVMVM